MEEIAQVFGINWKLLLIQMVNFGALLFALWYLLYRPVMRMIDERKKKVAKGVEDAEKAEAHLSEIDETRDGIISKATNEATGIVTTSKTRAQEQGSEIVVAAHKKAETVLEDATLRADETQRKAMEESRADIARSAMLAAEKILREAK